MSVLSTKLAKGKNPSGMQTLEMPTRFVENLCIPALFQHGVNR